MPGIIDFALGMSTGGFTAAIQTAGEKLNGFLGDVLNFGALTDGVMKAFETGTGLEALHRRAGESAASLFQLQEGFKAAGLSAGDVETSLQHMQRALGGVNDLGKGTPEIFRSMGLKIETLRQQNAPPPFQSIANALGSLNPKAAAGAANGIFGIMDSSKILQLAGNTREFGDRMRDAIKEGQNWQGVSEAFARIKSSMDGLKNIGNGFFAGLAGDLAGSLQTGLNLLNSFKSTLTGLGQHIGNLFKGVTEASKEGKLGDVIDGIMKSGLAQYMSGYHGVGKAFAEAYKNTGGQAQDQLNSFWAGLIARSPNMPTSPGKTNPPPLVAPPTLGNHKPEFTSLEKMGFVMGGANPALDYARRTATATEKIAAFFSVQNQITSVQGATSVQSSFNAV